jgi:hypothetical protein
MLSLPKNTDSIYIPLSKERIQSSLPNGNALHSVDCPSTDINGHVFQRLRDSLMRMIFTLPKATSTTGQEADEINGGLTDGERLLHHGVKCRSMSETVSSRRIV